MESPFPDSAGNGNRGLDWPQIGKSGMPRCVSTACTILGYNAASKGCHSTGQLAMSDKQTTMSNDTLEKIVCLRNSRMAVTVLKTT